MIGLLMGAVLLAQVPPYVLFGEGSQWLVLDGTGELVRRIDEFPPGIPHDVREAAINSEGTQLAVTAWLDSAQNVMLFLWDLQSGAAHQIGEREGFHAAPSFSRDGSRLTFAHHPRKGGPPGSHQAGSYAQLYEQSLRTLELKQLTSTNGCHMESSGAGDRLYFAHADCNGGRRIEVLQAGKVTALTGFEDVHGEPSLSKDGRRLVFTRDRGDDIELAELRVGKARSKPTTLWRGPRRGTRFRPQYLRDGRVMFQNGRKVFVLVGGAVEFRLQVGGVQ